MGQSKREQRAAAAASQGLAFHQTGRLDDARRCYDQALALHPRNFDALHLLGVFFIQTGDLARAVDLIRKAISVRSDVVGAHGNLANALNSLQRHGEALEASDRALALNPAFAEAHGNRGQALHQLGRLPEALESYERVVALKPTAQAHYNQAAMLRELGQFAAALASYEQAIALKPDYAEAFRGRGMTLADLGHAGEGLASQDQAIALKPDYAEAWCSRGMALRDLGRPPEALASQDQAIALRPAYAEAFANRGNALFDLGRHADALAAYDRAVGLKPDHAEALSNKVAPLRQLCRPEDALIAADQAIALKPGYAEGHNNRGGALYDLRRLEEALASYDLAIALKPDYADAFNNRGAVLFELRRFEDAMLSYDRAIAGRPDFADAHHNQAMCRLMLGDFAQGWAQYEWRWRTDQLGGSDLPAEAPRWRGDEPLQGHTILLRAEQGLGDTLQFCRYAMDVAALGAEVILEVQPGLERLLAKLAGVKRIIRRGEPPPRHDFEIPLMSLPLALGAAPGTAGSYLCADPDAAAEWAGRVPSSGAFRVGVCWAGGLRPDQLVANSIDQRRSLPLAAIAPLAELKDVAFYSLQKGPPAAQLTEAQARGWPGPRIIDLTQDIADFADTAALVDNLDLVITCDTAVAHLAGAMGKPVWILNRFDACWRWLRHGEDSCWYPTARLFRQAAPGDWASVVEEVAEALKIWRDGRQTSGAPAVRRLAR